MSFSHEDRLLAMTIRQAQLDLKIRHPWRKKGLCRGADIDLFILPSGVNAYDGKKLCARCPCKAQCYEFAVEYKCVGLWGGVVFTVNSTPSGPAGEPVEIRPMTAIENGKPVSLIDSSVLEVFS